MQSQNSKYYQNINVATYWTKASVWLRNSHTSLTNILYALILQNWRRRTPNGGKRLFSSPKQTDKLQGSPSPLFNIILGALYTRVKKPQHEANHWLPSTAMAKNEHSHTSTPLMPTWHSQEQLYLWLYFITTWLNIFITTYRLGYFQMETLTKDWMRTPAWCSQISIYISLKFSLYMFRAIHCPSSGDQWNVQNQLMVSDL